MEVKEMKYEWRKKDKELYLPKAIPTVIELSPLQYLTIKGEGNPNDLGFKAAIQALYAYSYGIKMSPKKGIETAGYFDYTVFPLEAFWDSKVVPVPGQPLDKDQFIYHLMIRQPEFVTAELMTAVKAGVVKKIGADQAERVQLETITEGKNLQMLHVGSYDSEPVSFEIMSQYCQEHGLQRVGHVHKEIYLSNAEKVEASKLKTVLRFPIH